MIYDFGKGFHIIRLIKSMTLYGLERKKVRSFGGTVITCDNHV